MLRTKYDVLVRNGKYRFLVIPEKDYQAMRERLEDEADYRALEESRRKQVNSPRYTLEEVKRELAARRRASAAGKKRAKRDN